MTGSAPGAPAARASSVETPAAGRPSASANARPAARPMRIPVKLPGPVPRTSASIRDRRRPPRRSSASTSSSSVSGRDEASARTSPSQTSALVATSVAVSHASRSTVARAYCPRRQVPVTTTLPPVASRVPKLDDEPRRGQRVGAGLGPLHEHDALGRSTARGPPTPPPRGRRTGTGRGATRGPPRRHTCGPP